MTDEKALRSRAIRQWLLPGAMGLLVILLCLVFLLVPSSFPQIVVEQEVFAADAASPGAWEADFELETTSPRLRVSVKADAGPVELLLDLTGPPGVYLLVDFPVHAEDYRFWCGRDLPAGRYTLRVREQRVTGAYRLEVARPPRVSFHLRTMILLGFMALLSAFLWLRSVKTRQTGIRKSGTMHWVFAFGGSGICALLVYLVFHEGGHALVALLLGTLDLGHSDPFGLSGRPHISYREGMVLTDWQVLVRAAAGPLLPTFVGFISFALWRSRWGRAVRVDHQAGDVFWSLLTFGLLMGQVGMLLPVMRLAHDGDYDTMIRDGPVPGWMIDGTFLLLGIVALALVYRIVRDMVRLVRIALRHPS